MKKPPETLGDPKAFAAGQSFALVPWTPALEQQRGREVSGIAKDSGGIEWSFAHQRGLEI
jgi:hypothetical protein